MKKINMKEEKAITLVALVITVIILLILAGVALSLVIGENGLISKSKIAIKKSNAASELEKVELSVTNASIGEQGLRELTKENLQNALDNGFGIGTAGVSDKQSDGSYIVTIGENTYIISGKGKIEKDETEQVIDANPGEFAGSGTEELPYLIESIEDLVALATNVNGGEKYNGKYFKLTITLDFKSNKSYVNPQSKYVYNAEKDGYEPDESGKAIKELCTTEEGFITIGRQGYEKRFEGNVLGNNCAIRNLYINIQPESSNASKDIGVFGLIQNNTIKDLSVTGQITASNEYVGGIVGYGNNDATSILNCNSSVNIVAKSDGYIGGIVGCLYGKIENCTNTGEINVEVEKDPAVAQDDTSDMLDDDL